MSREPSTNLGMAEVLVLVDPNDHEVGTSDKLSVHQQGLLHRAFSVYVFDSSGRMLLTRRAASKYHCGGLWTNTCCSHVRPGEATDDAAHRRLREEAGIDCELTHAFHFIYRAPFTNGLTEHELDHVYVGTHDGDPDLDPTESNAFEWVDPDALSRDVKANPDKYTVWMALSLDRAIEAQRSRRLTT